MIKLITQPIGPGRVRIVTDYLHYPIGRSTARAAGLEIDPENVEASRADELLGQLNKWIEAQHDKRKRAR